MVGLRMTLFSEKMPIFHKFVPMWFDAQLDQKILYGINCCCCDLVCSATKKKKAENSTPHINDNVQHIE